MCNKICDGMCYPPMLKCFSWLYFKCGEVLEVSGLYWKLLDGELYFGKESSKLEKVCGNSK